VLASRIMGVIAELREKTELTVLLVEQNAKSALKIADRGVVLGVGRVVAEDDSGKLAADDKLRQAYLGF
jgi:branched-chain amino acid transport system ATP-binding protein